MAEFCRPVVPIELCAACWDGTAGPGVVVGESSRSPGAPPLILTTMSSRLPRSGCCVVSLVAAYRKCSDDDRRTAQNDMIRDAYHKAGHSQCMVSGIGHEKQPMTAAASRLAWDDSIRGGCVCECFQRYRG